jgi:hypothetical protein
MEATSLPSLSSVDVASVIKWLKKRNVFRSAVLKSMANVQKLATFHLVFSQRRPKSSATRRHIIQQNFADVSELYFSSFFEIGDTLSKK